MAMEEIQDKQKDMKQLVDIAQTLYERSQELAGKNDEHYTQLQTNLIEMTKMSDELMQIREENHAKT